MNTLMDSSPIAAMIDALRGVSLPSHVERLGVCAGGRTKYVHALVKVGKAEKFITVDIFSRSGDEIAAEFAAKVEAARAEIAAASDAADAEFGRYFEGEAT